MLTIRRVQLTAVAATVLVAGGGYYLAATYTGSNPRGIGWTTAVIVLLTIAGVALCGAAVALLSLIRYIGRESKVPLDHLEAGLAGLALVSLPFVLGNQSFQGSLLPVGVLAVSVAALCVVVLARAGYTRFTAGGR
jgi:hypothetical protein